MSDNTPKVDPMGFPILTGIVRDVALILMNPIMGTDEWITVAVAVYDDEGILVVPAWDWSVWPNGGALEGLYSKMVAPSLYQYWGEHKTLEGWTGWLQGYKIKLTKSMMDTREETAETMKKHWTFMSVLDRVPK